MNLQNWLREDIRVLYKRVRDGFHRLIEIGSKGTSDSYPFYSLTSHPLSLSPAIVAISACGFFYEGIHQTSKEWLQNVKNLSSFNFAPKLYYFILVHPYETPVNWPDWFLHEEQERQECSSFMTLRKLNRWAHIRLKKGREVRPAKPSRKTAAAPEPLYDLMHLQKEITKCLEFKSKHKEIDPVSLKEFYKEPPPDISKAEVTMGDPHQQTLARLDWELKQRKRLAETYCECLSNKEKILKETEVQREDLSSVQPHLSSLMQASLLVQEYLIMLHDQAHKQYETADTCRLPFMPSLSRPLHMGRPAIRRCLWWSKPVWT